MTEQPVAERTPSDPHARPLAQAPRARSLGALVLARLIALSLLLALTVAEPEPTQIGLPAWPFIALYAGYSLAIELLGRRWSWLRTRLMPALDLALAGALYLAIGRADGAVYALVFVAVVSSAATLPLRGALGVVAGATLILIGGDLLRRQSWALDTVVADIGAQLLTLGFVAFVAVVQVRRVHDQESEVQRSQRHAEHLAELDRLRETFVAAVSHDLQTPLTAARAGLGMLEASARERLSPEEARLLANARRSIDRLGLQINDLILLNQIEANAFVMVPHEFDVRGVIAAVVATAHPLLAQKAQALHVDAAAPVVVVGDRRHLEQALLNLVMNAHQHSPPGTTIAIATRAEAGEAIIQVTDTGPGIPREAMQRIFDRYYRLDAAPGGSGLGLSIVKTIAESHGGRVQVESEPGHGSTVSLILPTEATHAASRETHGAPELADCR